MFDMTTTDDQNDVSSIPAVSALVPRSRDLASFKASEGSTWRDAARAGGLDWTATLRPLYLASPRDDGKTVLSQVHMHAIERDDTRQVLGYASPQYGVSQPMNVLQGFAEHFEGTGLQVSLDRIGVFKGGTRFVVMSKLPESMNIGLFGGRDVIQPMLMLRTSFDKSWATKAVLGFWRHACTNGMVASFPGAPVFKMHVSHTKHEEQRRANATATIGHMRDAFVSFGRGLVDLTEKKVTPAQAMKVVPRIILPPKRAALNPSEWTNAEKVKVQTVMDLADRGRGTDIPGVRGTAYGLLQAVTEYSNHYAPAKGDALTAARTRFERVVGGVSEEERALSILVKL